MDLYIPVRKGMPISRGTVDLESGTRVQAAGTLGSALLAMIRFLHTPTIDGGHLGDTPDACVAASIRDETGDLTEAMSYLYNNMDGGVLS